VGTLVVIAPEAAHAQSRCLALKFKAFGAAAKVKAGCHARAAKAGMSVDPDCLAAADAKLAKKWAKASGLDDCSISGPVVHAAQSVDDCVGEMDAVASPPPPSTEPCCQLPDGTCGHGSAVAAVCSTLGGTIAPSGTSCDAGTGTCVTTAPTGGRCCMEASGLFCQAGPALDLSGCTPPNFLDFPFGATCASNGACTLL